MPEVLEATLPTTDEIFGIATKVITEGAKAGVQVVSTLAENTYGQIVLGIGIAGVVLGIGFAIFRKVL